MAWMRSQSSMVVVRTSPREVSAAGLFTRMSSRPKWAAAQSTSCRHCDASVRSLACECRAGAGLMSDATTAAPRGSERPFTITAAPRAANCSAIPLPMPDVDPVTSADPAGQVEGARQVRKDEISHEDSKERAHACRVLLHRVVDALDGLLRRPTPPPISISSDRPLGEVIVNVSSIVTPSSRLVSRTRRPFFQRVVPSRRRH